MKINYFFNTSKKIVLWPFLSIKKMCLKLIAVLSSAYKYFYLACDLIVKNTLSLTQSVHNAFTIVKDQSKKEKKKKSILKITISIIIIGLLFLTLRQFAFFVPVGGGAVVTRFGGYQRSVSTGLHFRVPILERFYIVQKGFIKQQTFGYIQVVQQLNHTQLTDKAIKVQTEYEEELLQKEQDDEVFSKKGDISDSLDQDQRLTHDYIREINGHTWPYTLRQANALLERNKDTLVNINKLGVSVNGRIPLDRESRLITSNLNLLNLKWAIQYRIGSMRNYLFNSRDVEQNIRDLSLASMSKIIGEHNFFPIISTDRNKIENKVRDEVQSAIDQLQLGITITNIIIVDAIPVDEVLPSFDEVNKATQTKQTSIYNAQKNYNQKIPLATGEAKRIVSIAKAKALQIINEAMGNASQFDSLLIEYNKMPEIIKDRLYINTINLLLNNKNITFVDSSIKGILPIFTPTGLPNLNTGGLPFVPSAPPGKNNVQSVESTSVNAKPITQKIVPLQ